jgi:hypothetical protein
LIPDLTERLSQNRTVGFLARFHFHEFLDDFRLFLDQPHEIDYGRPLGFQP